jgi:hypothetical protein
VGGNPVFEKKDIKNTLVFFPIWGKNLGFPVRAVPDL